MTTSIVSSSSSSSSSSLTISENGVPRQNSVPNARQAARIRESYNRTLSLPILSTTSNANNAEERRYMPLYPCSTVWIVWRALLAKINRLLYWAHIISAETCLQREIDLHKDNLRDFLPVALENTLLNKAIHTVGEQLFCEIYILAELLLRQHEPRIVLTSVLANPALKEALKNMRLPRCAADADFTKLLQVMTARECMDLFLIVDIHEYMYTNFCRESYISIEQFHVIDHSNLLIEFLDMKTCTQIPSTEPQEMPDQDMVMFCRQFAATMKAINNSDTEESIRERIAYFERACGNFLEHAFKLHQETSISSLQQPPLEERYNNSNIHGRIEILTQIFTTASREIRDYIHSQLNAINL